MRSGLFLLEINVVINNVEIGTDKSRLGISYEKLKIIRLDILTTDIYKSITHDLKICKLFLLTM